MADKTKVDLQIPFPTNRTAEVAYHVLRVDIEPKRSQVNRTLSFKDNILHCTLEGPSARQVRTSVTSFFEKIDLIVETFANFGEPVSDQYDHFNTSENVI